MKKYKRPKLKIQTSDEVDSCLLDKPSRSGKKSNIEKNDKVRKKLEKDIAQIEKFLIKMYSFRSEADYVGDSFTSDFVRERENELRVKRIQLDELLKIESDLLL